MVRTIRLLLVWAVLGMAVPGGFAQPPQALPAPSSVPYSREGNGIANVGPLFPQWRGQPGTPPTSAVQEPDILRELPEIPDLPASLYQPAPPPEPPPPAADRPYFELDPILNPGVWPQPGWFGDVQLGILKPHISDGVINTLPNPSGGSNVVTLPTAPLGWTVSPFFTVGYRLGSGAGSLSLNYRFLDASGSTTTGALDGLVPLRSRLDVQQVDFVYSSREYTPLTRWYLKWFLGLRWASVFWDNQATEPFDVAAAGGGVFLERTSNIFQGFGPLFGVEMNRNLGQDGLFFTTRLIGAGLLGYNHQTFVEGFTVPGPNGAPQVASARVSGGQGVPVLNVQVGLDWRPASCKALHVFVGGQYEHWWNVGKNTKLQLLTNSFGELSALGFVLQAGWNY